MLASWRGVVPVVMGLALSAVVLPQTAADPVVSPMSGRPGTTVTVTGTVTGGGPVPVVVSWDGGATAVCETALGRALATPRTPSSSSASGP